MAENLTWYPLYWVYHDFWKWTYSKPHKQSFISYPVDHVGHIHYFMLDFPVKDNENQQAYFGEQKYTFELQSTMGEESAYANKQNNIRVVGRPKWYFYIAEYWRRIYIQDWNDPANEGGESVTGNKGIRYDASKDCHSRGPYREGKDNYFFSSKVNRTLPVEYWINSEKTIRNHYLRSGKNADDEDSNIKDDEKFVWNFGLLGTPGYEEEKYTEEIIKEMTEDEKKRIFGSYPRRNDNEIPHHKPFDPEESSSSSSSSSSGSSGSNENIEEEENIDLDYSEINPELHPWSDYFEEWDDWTIPRTETCKGGGVSEVHPGTVSYSEEDKARWNYPDKYFISPIIEYQKVIHSNWERYAGWEERDIDREVDEDGIETGVDFGDDWSVEITIPYKIKDVIQSPFSDDKGKVYPIGTYCHGLEDAGKIKPLKYNKNIYDKAVKNDDWKVKGLKTSEIEKIALSMNKCLPEKDLAFDENGKQKNVIWNYPEHFPETKDGMWVEQCLGAMVIGKARVVLEDNFGKRTVQWIEKTSFSVGDVFEGKDYDAKSQENVGKQTIYFKKDDLTLDPVTKKLTLVLSETVINKFTIFDNDGIKRAVPQSQEGSDALLDFTGVNVKGTWSIEFPK